MDSKKLSEKEQTFVECFSQFVNGQMGSASKVGNALANDHRYLVNEKGKVVFAFLERLADDYQKGHYDQRDEWACRLAAETLKRKECIAEHLTPIDYGKQIDYTDIGGKAKVLSTVLTGW